MEVLVEGGSETARGFLDQGLVDRAHLFLSPRILGGRDAIPLVGGVSPERVDQALDLECVEVDRVGPDLYVTGTIKKR
jgi:diaminohydroxyphosphoribosylaminopyrimidine deaminase/5-amino-6-(5-phosphoribosylamino)uracil reductase